MYVALDYERVMHTKKILSRRARSGAHSTSDSQIASTTETHHSIARGPSYGISDFFVKLNMCHLMS